MVMAMMMVSLISYVQSAGELWQKSHATITLSNEGCTLLDYIERELWVATSISTPAIGATSNKIVYAKMVSDYQLPPATCTLDFQITFDPVTHVASSSIIVSGANWVAATADSWALNTVSGAKKVLLSRHNFDVCRSLKSLTVTRTANRLLDVSAILSITRVDESEREIEFRRSIIMR